MNAERPTRTGLQDWFERVDALLAEYEQRYRRSAEYLGARN